MTFFFLILHPIKIDETSLVIPELKEILLKNKEHTLPQIGRTYILY